MGDATLAIHAGEEKFRVGAPVGTAISRTANFTFESTEEMKRWAEGKSSAYIYTRYGNPTLAIAEAKIAALEGAEDAVVAASGIGGDFSGAALAVARGRRTDRDAPALWRQLPAAARCVSAVRNRGSPRRGRSCRHRAAGQPAHQSDLHRDADQPDVAARRSPKAAAFAKEWGLISIVDNTFASPVLQKPIAIGFNLVVHSASKYLAGHSDVIAGAAAGSAALIRKVRENVIQLGGSMDPEAAFLLIRGMKTLEVRVERQCKNAMAVAKFLAKHPKVSRVHYPGLPTHPDHALARKQMRGFGAMMAFDLKGGVSAARRFCDRVRIFLLAASLGGVESLVILPIYTSHHKMSAAELRGAGVEPGTVRVSVGLEDPHDLIEDLRQALA